MEPITKERAQAILVLMGMGKDETMIFEEDLFDYEHTILIGEEFHRLEKDIDKNIDECKNESELVSKLECKWLNPKEVIKTVIQRRFADYDGYANYETLKHGRI